MYYERRRAFEARIKQVLSDHLKAVGQKGIQGRFVKDLSPRILSAMEDAFQLGKKDQEPKEVAASMVATAFRAAAKRQAEELDPRECPNCHAEHDHAQFKCIACTVDHVRLPEPEPSGDPS